jgi:hypothetical protein
MFFGTRAHCVSHRAQCESHRGALLQKNFLPYYQVDSVWRCKKNLNQLMSYLSARNTTAALYCVVVELLSMGRTRMSCLFSEAGESAKSLRHVAKSLSPQVK